MCGRFTLTQSAEAIAQHFDTSAPSPYAPRYNIAPSQPVLAVVADAQGDPTRQLQFFRWGLIPSWSKDPLKGAPLFNARSETVAEKPSFRTAFKRRRCLIPADGFYEWRREGKAKQPFYFCMGDCQPFGFAGLWEHWENGNGDSVDSCTILTTTPNELLNAVHDRMPVILDPSDYDLWLDPTVQQPDRLLPLMHPYPDEAMTGYPVNPVVNSATVDSAECVTPVGD
jgi:putative SOS response-associated peptidase YedK